VGSDLFCLCSFLLWIVSLIDDQLRGSGMQLLVVGMRLLVVGIQLWMGGGRKFWMGGVQP